MRDVVVRRMLDSSYWDYNGNNPFYDATGNPTANMTLSERRALSVKNYITQSFPNIDPNRFQTIGRGSSNPVANNATETGRQLNRRTEIKVVLATQ